MASYQFQLSDACSENNISKMKEIIIDFKISKTNKYDAHHSVFILAIKNKNIEMVKFLLTDPIVKPKININFDDDLALRTACKINSIEIVKYLLTSSSIQQHSNISANNHQSFRISCKENYGQLIHFFIFDMQIKLTTYLKEFLENSKTPLKNKNEIEKLFNIRNLMINIESNTESSLNVSTKSKI